VSFCGYFGEFSMIALARETFFETSLIFSQFLPKFTFIVE